MTKEIKSLANNITIFDYNIANVYIGVMDYNCTLFTP